MDDRYSEDGPAHGSASPPSAARVTFNRFKDSVPGRVSSLQDRVSSLQGSLQGQISALPDKFPQVVDKLQSLQVLPDRFQERAQDEPTNSPPDTMPSRNIPRSSTPPAPPISTPPSMLLKAPSMSDPEYDSGLAALAGKILYRSGVDPESGGPLLILCAASFPDAKAVDYNKLLPYVLSVLPGDEELGPEEEGGGYSVVFFSGGGAVPGAGGGGSGGGGGGGYRPSWAWTLQAYHLVCALLLSPRLGEDNSSNKSEQLGRAVRKRIRKLWVVHEKAWVRIIFEMLAGVVSVKFRKKVVHCTLYVPVPVSSNVPQIANRVSLISVNTLSDLALHLDITTLRIPPAVYFHDRKLSPAITIPSPPSPTFSRPPFHTSANPPRVGENMPLPKVLVDTYRYLRSSCLSVEGLFRVPPHAVLLDILREAVDREQAIKWDEWGPYTAAALVKLYYRSLPEPIFPYEYYGRLISLTNETEEKGEDEVFSSVRTLLESEEKGLPKSSRVLLLKHLLPLLALVAQHSDVNRMTPLNLAVCIAGSLVRSDDMVADAKASSGVRKFLEVAIERLEELAPKLPDRNSSGGSYRSDMEQLGVGIDINPPTPPTSPPSYNAGKRVQRKMVPGTPTGGAGAVVSRKRIPARGSSVDAQNSLDSEASKAPALPQPAILAPSPVVHRRGSISSFSTAMSASTTQSTVPSTAPSAKMPGPEEGRGGIVLRRKASLQALVKEDTGTLLKGPSSSLSPHPSPMTRSLSVSSPMPPRVVRRAISSSYLPSSSSLFSSPYSPNPPSASSSSNVAAIANSLSRAQFNPSLNPNNPNNPNNPPVPPAPPMARARTESIIGNRSRAGTGASMIERTMPAAGSGVVEELRALYEERAKGVEVLVRGGVMGSVKGRWKEQ